MNIILHPYVLFYSTFFFNSFSKFKFISYSIKSHYSVFWIFTLLINLLTNLMYFPN